MSNEFDFTYLSLGAGWQSSALLVLACTDERVPKPDAAIFADTGDEPHWVYDQVAALTPWAAGHGVPIHTAQKGVLSDWVIKRQQEGKRFVNVPLYTLGENGQREGMLRRQCTREFKIEPITQKVRELLGYEPRQRVKERVRGLMGISLEEASRMKPSRLKWITHTYPLVDLGIRRHECPPIVIGAGLPSPGKSACVFCPYRSDPEWQEMKTNYPDEFQRAVEFDRAIRDMTMAGRRQPGFVHRSCRPLDEVEFTDESQVELFTSECEGMCGI